MVQRLVGAVKRFIEMVVRVVDVKDVDLVDAEPRHALVDGAHDAVVGEVEDGIERWRFRKGVALRRPAGPEQLAHLGREDILVARLAAQNRAKTLLRKSVSVLRGGVEETDSRRPRGLDDPMRLVVRQRLEQTAQRSGAEAKPRDFERRAAEPDTLGRVQAEAPVAT